MRLGIGAEISPQVSRLKHDHRGGAVAREGFAGSEDLEQGGSGGADPGLAGGEIFRSEWRISLDSASGKSGDALSRPSVSVTSRLSAKSLDSTKLVERS